jgi:hypothetical protein
MQVSQIVSQESSVNGVDILLEQVLTSIGGHVFVATYTRARGEPVIIYAKHAVEAMCPISKA